MGDSTRSDVRSKRGGAVGPAMAFARVPFYFGGSTQLTTADFEARRVWQTESNGFSCGQEVENKFPIGIVA